LSEELRLEMRGISKRFGGVRALENVDFLVRPGEIHALVGENGAGKSTLMKILSGVYSTDKGEIYVNGEKMQTNNPVESANRGVSVIYQEYALATDLTVAENIFLDNITVGQRFVNWKLLRQKARELLERLNFGDIDETAIVSDLSIAYQQVVEICKSLSRDVSILVLDEPTALLSNKEVDKLFELLFTLKKQGVSIVYISHRLDEIFRITDRITVLKDGQTVGTVNTADVDKETLVNMMIGRSISDYYPERNAVIGETVLEVKNINYSRRVKNVSFSVRAGEVLGLTGLVGSGRTETTHAIFGITPMESGTIIYNGKEITIANPYQALQHGIGYLSEDRKNTGVLLDLSIRENITISIIDNFIGAFQKIKSKLEVEFVKKMVKDLAIKIGTIEDNVSSLSGGNQQKVAIGKVLATKCKVLIFDEPTRGVDVGSKREIYRIINSMAENGCAVVMISSEMEEIIGMCDRAIVMREGRVMGELQKEDINEENLIHLAMEV
jgi:ribose transport system ATP-binding protein